MIWLLRHGDAEDGGAEDDASRKLTGKGRRQSRDAGRAMRALGVSLDVCLTSPKLRARETAELCCAELGVPVELDERLRGGAFDPLELVAGWGEALLVGHEPDFSRAVAHLTGSRIRFRKGGLAALDEHLLHGLYRPRDLRTMAG